MYLVIDEEMVKFLKRIPVTLAVIQENYLMVGEKHGIEVLKSSNGCMDKFLWRLCRCKFQYYARIRNKEKIPNTKNIFVLTEL